jgi:hypothetical protein
MQTTNNASGDYMAARVSSSAVPEPSTWAMIVLGLAGVAYVGSRPFEKKVPLRAKT